MINTRQQIQSAAFSSDYASALFFSWPVIQRTIAKAVPIRYVQVEGAFQYIDKQDIQMKIDPLVQAGYFSVDLQVIQQAVMSLPWTASIQVQRVWPDRIKLKIYEQKTGDTLAGA